MSLFNQLFDGLSRTIHKNLDVRMQRQNLIAGNVVNADTPNYIPVDLDFKATLAAVVGVAVMMGAAASGGRVSGNVLAFGMAVLMSLVLVLIRRNPGVGMLPAVGLSAFLCALIVLPFARPLSVSGQELLLLALFGTSQFGLGLLLLALGTPLVSATRGALIGVLQTPLGTFWVWLAFGETPGWTTLAGGAIVVAAVICDIAIRRPQEEIT